MSFPVKRYESYDFFVFFTDIVGVLYFFTGKFVHLSLTSIIRINAWKI